MNKLGPMGRAWEQLAAVQAGMLSQAQLTGLGVTRSEVRSHLRVQRWAQRTSHVFSTTTGPLSWDQRLWLAVLHAGTTALIGGLTAAKVHGLRNWERDAITVLVDNPLSFEPLDGVKFFRTRRPLDDMRARGELPLARVEPAVLLFAGYERHRRTAHGALAAVVQQRLTDVQRLGAELEQLRPLPRAKEFRALFGDVGGGAQSLAEVDLRRACREFGIAPANGAAPATGPEREAPLHGLRVAAPRWPHPGPRGARRVPRRRAPGRRRPPTQPQAEHPGPDRGHLLGIRAAP